MSGGHVGLFYICDTDVVPKTGRDRDLHVLIHDAKRFILYYRPIIEKAPLQLYSTALIFAPEKSVVREQFLNEFLHEFPRWITGLPEVRKDWSALLQTLEGHSGWVNAVAFSPDGQLLASASDEGPFRLWDARTGALRDTLQRRSGWVNAVAFSPDGQLLVSASDDGTVKLWDARTGVLRDTLEGHSDWVKAIAFSPDGQLLASASDDGTVRLWDARTGALRDTFLGDSGWVRAVAFSPDGLLLASTYDGKTVWVWNTSTGNVTEIFNNEKRVHELSFSSDGSYLETNYGLFKLSHRSHSLGRPQSSFSPHLCVDNHWVQWRSVNLLWLPSEYRATCVAVCDNVLAMGHASGRVTFIKFDLKNMPLSESFHVYFTLKGLT